MKKDYMKRCFKEIERAEAAVEDSSEEVQQAISDLRSIFEEGRSLWWKDNVRTFNAVYKLLNSFYRQAWSCEFRDTERKRRALRFFTNQVLDQFVLGGDEARRNK